ncbi:MAG: ligand-binding sensor domain-containing protein, partial [Bacteroidota bacterium]
MKQRARLLLIGFLVLLLIDTVEGQQYRFHQYRVEQGLPSDVIKAVAQDSLGFLWIATDEGLVKYDGLNFTTYKSAFRSQYAKGFVTTRDGRLLSIGDLDMIEIQNRVDTVIFKTLLRGARNPTDTTIWYPKSIYEDLVGNIWLAEPQSVIRFDGKDMKRFDFGMENRSPVFIRSFSFFEDKRGNFYCSSYQGNVFVLEQDKNAFRKVEVAFPQNVSHVLVDHGRLWIAAGDGLYEGRIENLSVVDIRKTLPVLNISHLLIAPDSMLWVSTFGEDLYRVSRKGNNNWELLTYNFNGINHCYLSDEEDVWASTDKGLVLIQRNIFALPDPESQTHFIEAIAEDRENNLIYYCNKESLFKLDHTPDGKYIRKEMYTGRNNYFQGLQFGDKGLWAASAFDVLLFDQDRLVKRWNFESEGNFVHDIFLDSKQRLWLSQAGNSEVKVISDSFNIRRFKIPVKNQSEINLVREGREGIYVAASGIEKYLFYKPNNEREFKDISLPVTFPVEGDFNIHDMTVHQGIIWIASTEGLLKYDHRSITRIDLEVFTNFSVSSVEELDHNNILFSNSYGLFRYDISLKEFWLYDENSGLPSNTITRRGIFVDNEKHLWVGTSYGIANTLESIVKDIQTPTPYCVEVRVNGQRKLFHGGVQVPYGSFIDLKFSSITFPENKLHFQWRVNNELTWHNMDNREFSLADLSAGSYRILVRAKKNTGLSWSKPTMVNISVGKPYWQRLEFAFLLMLFVLTVSWISYSVSSKILNKRKELLQNLVHERTLDLEKANEELTLRNTELDRFVYSASHDLSAPLKSVLGLINVARMEKPGETQQTYLTLMERSVRKLEEFIQEVVSYSRNTRMPVKIECFKFEHMMKSLLLDHQYTQGYDKINFIIEDHSGGE